MTKKQLIKKVKNLGFGEILYGFKEGKVINVNEYDEENDTFNTYGEDMKCNSLTFEELPRQLWRND